MKFFIILAYNSEILSKFALYTMLHKNMKEKTLRFLEAHESHEASSFVDEAKWRQENNAWIRWSQSIALKIVDFMQENNLSRADIAERLGCTPQYVSKILSGKTNFSFKTIAEIERRLGISCMEKAFA